MPTTIHRHWNEYTVDGIPGRYVISMRNSFNRVEYYAPGCPVCLVASVSAGTYDPPVPNPIAREQIEAAIRRHAGDLLAS